MNATFEERNAYGYPVIARADIAKAYAENVLKRRAPVAQELCPKCQEEERLQRVVQLTSNWNKQKEHSK